MPNRTNTLLTILLVAAAGSAAAAPSDAGPEDRFPISINNAETRLEERLAKLDVDGSETISLEEFEQAETPMGQAGKRKMQRHRGKGPAKGMRGERQAELREAVDAEVFGILDANGDGSVSEAEYAQADRSTVRRLAHKRVMFKHLDKDADGLLQFSELAHPVERLRAADADGDGLVTREEMRSHHFHRRGDAQASNNG